MNESDIHFAFLIWRVNQIIWNPVVPKENPRIFATSPMSVSFTEQTLQQAAWTNLPAVSAFHGHLSSFPLYLRLYMVSNGSQVS